MENEAKLQLLIEEFLKNYESEAEKLFGNMLKTTPKAFPLFHLKEYLSIYHLKLNEDYFTGSESESIFIFDNLFKGIKQIDLSKEPIENFGDKYTNQLNATNWKKYIDDSLETKGKPLLARLRLSDLKNIPKGLAKIIVKEHAYDFKQHQNLNVKRYHKDIRNSYSHYDIQPMIAKVNDEDFSYQIDEALKCMEQNLYLPAAATIAVALETVLVLILEKNNIKIKESDNTIIGELSRKLRENKIINYREMTRLEVAYKLRNTISHSNKGKVLITDCETLLNTISVFIDEYIV